MGVTVKEGPALTIWAEVIFLPHSNLQDISCSKLPELKLNICARETITLTVCYFKAMCTSGFVTITVEFCVPHDLAIHQRSWECTE